MNRWGGGGKEEKNDGEEAEGKGGKGGMEVEWRGGQRLKIRIKC